MKACNLIKLFISVLISVVLLISNMAFSESSLPEVYQAIEVGQLAKADAMIKEVLKNHPNSGKAHYIASELYLKEGKLDAARNAFNRAESLAPGLPFAQPDSVQRLRVQLHIYPAPTQINTSSSPIFTSSIFWVVIAILIAGLIFFVRRRSKSTQFYSEPSANGPHPPGYPSAPASGIGSGLMGGLATGAALGAGMVAGEALASHLIGGGQRTNLDGNNEFSQAGDQAPLDAENFGINDASSWDDGVSSSWDDSGSGFMDSV